MEVAIRFKQQEASNLKPLHVWISPDRSYAVIEKVSEYFVAGKIVEYDEVHESMIVEWVDECITETNEVDLHFYNVDWDTMSYGFCKLQSWGMESNQYRTFRFYFDPELYKKLYKEKYGVPCKETKCFKRSKKDY